MSPHETAEIDGLLVAARGGDERAFGRLVEIYRPALQAHCYRMLGSVQDAEDALQDALLNAWRALPRFEGRSSVKSWLYRIATNACLKLIDRRPKRLLPLDYGPAADPRGPLAQPILDPLWLEPFAASEIGIDEDPAAPGARYEQRESVELAFVAALQHLPARQRAVLILRDVLGFSARESASILDMSPAAVDTSLQRARRAASERLPERSQQATLRSLGDERLRAIVDAFIEAWERADVDALVAMLADDATIAMPPHPGWYRGREAVRSFLGEVVFGSAARWRLVPASANGQPALGEYRFDERAGRFEVEALLVPSLPDGEISELTSFRGPGRLADYGLPAHLADGV